MILARLEARAASGEDEAGRALAGASKASTSSAATCASAWRADLGEGAQARLLPPALALDAQHEAGAAAREGADPEGAVPRGSARRDRRRSTPCCAAGATTSAPATPRDKFNQVDRYVVRRLKRLRDQAQGTAPAAGRSSTVDARRTSTASGCTACAEPSATRRLRNAASLETTTGKPCAGNPHARFERGPCRNPPPGGES